jgi:hypothetical protein
MLLDSGQLTVPRVLVRPHMDVGRLVPRLAGFPVSRPVVLEGDQVTGFRTAVLAPVHEQAAPPAPWFRPPRDG